jgi:hypothetical protein
MDVGFRQGEDMTDEHEVELRTEIRDLVAKAKALVDMLDDAERNHGGLYAGKTMTAANELRLELARWKK